MDDEYVPGPVLFLCPFCKMKFTGRYDFAKAERHIRDAHQHRRETGGARRKRDPFDFLRSSPSGLLLEEAPV